MQSRRRSKQDLQLEIADLRLRMAEAQDILRAIRDHEVDALVVRAPQGDQIFALESADQAYRQMVEQMHDGAATVTTDGTVLYANRQFAHLLHTSHDALIGQPIGDTFLHADRPLVAALLQRPEGGRLNAHLLSNNGSRVPVALSASGIVVDDRSVVLLLFTDLTYERQADRVARLLRLATRLSMAVTGTQVAEAVINGALQALDAVAGLVAVPGEFSQQLRTLHTVGYSPGRASLVTTQALVPGHPVTDAILTGEMIKFENAHELWQQYPECPGPTETGEVGALLAMPLLVPERAIGGLLIWFAGSRTFDSDQRDFALTVAQQCAQALERASLHSELEQRVEARTADWRAAHARLAEANQQLLKEIAERREIQRQLERTREEERARVARELHDELGGTLTGLKMDVARVLKDSDLPERVHRPLSDVSATINTAMQAVRRLATDLRPQALDDLGLLPALEAHFGEFLTRTGLSGTFTCGPDHLDLNSETATACFRIFQEALTNIARHAQASAVEVHIEEVNGDLVLSVSDNGIGLPPSELAAHGHWGLVGMRERAHLLGATLQVVGAPGVGTSVRLKFPHLPPPVAS